MKTLPKNKMSGMRELFIKLTLFCALMSCGAPVAKVEIVPTARVYGFRYAQVVRAACVI